MVGELPESNNPHPQIPFHVRYAPSFEEQVAALEPDVVHRERRLEGIEFVIARIPSFLSRVGDTNLYRVVHDGIPAWRFWYTFDGVTVTMERVEIYEDDSAEDQ